MGPTPTPLNDFRIGRFINHANRLLLAALLAALCGQVQADTPSDTFGPDYVSVLGGVVLPAKSLDTTGKGATASGIFGHEFSTHWLGEINLQTSTFETGHSGGTDYYQNGLTVDAVLQLRDRQQGLFTPFVLAGVGAAYDDFYPNNRDGAAGLAEVGVGIVTPPLLTNGIRLRVDGRYVRDFHQGSHSEPRIIAGIDIPLGRIEHRIEVRQSEPVIREIVREREVVRELPPPIVHDSDGDGVPDDQDRCPDTPKGMRVDSHGCAIENQTYHLAGVNFEFDKATLTHDAELVLDRVALAFIGQPTLRAEVAGHTDTVGSQKSNSPLSQARAEQVRAYLIRQGVNPNQLVARGYGQSQLLVDPERSPADAQRNRRVELRTLTN
jgi:OmpA-OmpF porin, OOP family